MVKQSRTNRRRKYLNMSNEKTTKKESKKANNSEKKSVESASKSADKPSKETSKSSTGASEGNSTDQTSEKSSTSNKSASQTSISHFSSVSTKEYRSGWEAIFGSGKISKSPTKGKSTEIDFPIRLKIFDEDIKEDLRALLYKAFERQAQKQGYRAGKHKKLVDIEYNLECKIIKK